MTKIIRKWKDKTGVYQFGTDNKGMLHCRNVKEGVNMVMLDPCVKRKNKFYYKFINPKTSFIKFVER